MLLLLMQEQNVGCILFLRVEGPPRKHFKHTMFRCRSLQAEGDVAILCRDLILQKWDEDVTRFLTVDACVGKDVPLYATLHSSMPAYACPQDQNEMFTDQPAHPKPSC